MHLWYMCVVEVKEHRQRSLEKLSKMAVLNCTIELNFLVGNYFRYILNYCLSIPSQLFSYKQMVN